MLTALHTKLYITGPVRIYVRDVNTWVEDYIDVNIVQSKTTVKFTYSSITINPKETFKLYFSTSTYYSGKIHYQTDNANIASMTIRNDKKSFTIGGNYPGTTYVRVWLDNNNYSVCKVTVRDTAKVNFTYSSINIAKGKSFVLPYSTNQYYSGGIHWKINNVNVASVTPDYTNHSLKIDGVNMGTASVNLWLDNNNYTTCKINVSDYNDIKWINFNKSEIYLYEGYNTTISYSANRTLIGNEKVTLYNTNVASFNRKNNKVTIIAKNAGDTLVGVIAGGKTSYCKIHIRKKPSKIQFSQNNLYLYEGQKAEIAYNANVSLFGNEPVKVYNTNVANFTRNNNKITITAKNVGSTKIGVATLGNVCQAAYCNIKVLKKPSKVNFSHSSITIKEGESATITYSADTGLIGNEKIEISNTRKVNYTRNNNKITITGQKAGSTIIKVTAYGEKTATCMITVEESKRDKLVKFIEAQIGNSGTYSQNYYGANKNADWCCYFLGYCIDNTLGKGYAMNKLGLISSNNDGSLNKGLYASDAGSIARAAERTDTKIVMHRYGDGYIPKPGDIFIMCKNDKLRTHVGFIKKVVKDEKGNVIEYKTIEGNANNNDASKSTVDEFTRTYDTRDGESIDTHIYGFIDLSYYFDN